MNATDPSGFANEKLRGVIKDADKIPLNRCRRAVGHFFFLAFQGWK